MVAFVVGALSCCLRCVLCFLFRGRALHVGEERIGSQDVISRPDPTCDRDGRVEKGAQSLRSDFLFCHEKDRRISAVSCAHN